MRKFHIQQMQEILRTIEQMQDKKLYADCQEGALSLCDFIDSLAGEGTRPVVLLEEYCEMLFNVNNGALSEKVLRKQTSKIKHSVKTELKPTRTEAVFISHMASMSDSLETIYRAAKSDPTCDAYFIAVPYYERSRDGSFTQLHFEGAEHYPANIEITDWQAYDFEARCPDIIFTFNNYDAEGSVTAIHPNFYCERLRGFTGLLVYVPYFVGTENVGETHVDSAGCKFAHRVILQSEKIRDIYIKKFKKLHGNTYGRPADKFIALGSPKFDKVISSRREDFPLTESEHSLIAGKKVFLFNTSIAQIMRGNINYLKKIRFVIDTFRNRGDAVLWWRPHPLSQVTYTSTFPMLPQLLEEYRQIIQDYIEEGLGVFDESPDLHRAIAWSDAYYGDGSSVVIMCQSVGKPAMIQNYRVVSPGKAPAAPQGFNIKNGYCLEDPSCNLVHFIDFCTGKEKYEFAVAAPRENNGTAGQNIYDYSKKQMMAGET